MTNNLKAFNYLSSQYSVILSNPINNNLFDELLLTVDSNIPYLIQYAERIEDGSFNAKHLAIFNVKDRNEWFDKMEFQSIPRWISINIPTHQGYKNIDILPFQNVVYILTYHDSSLSTLIDVLEDRFRFISKRNPLKNHKLHSITEEDCYHLPYPKGVTNLNPYLVNTY